jgi:asparagine synthase (glutamine-hydrolysing)
MCGIAGYLNSNHEPASAVIAERMGRAIAHRGPDGEGTYVDGPCALTHRRLAVIDPTPAGHQPMVSRDDRFVLSYNGEIYNFRELRAELEARGHRFRSRTDSEVLLEGYSEWGLEVIPRLNGMFAFSIWDRRDQTLTLARDRYGIKPLYYVFANEAILFGSEVKALLQHPHCTAEIDLEGLLEYFTFQNFFTDRTLFDGVCLLRPGTWMQASAEAPNEPRTGRYWDYEFEEPDAPLSESEYVEELDRLFKQAVGRQLVADVPVGAYLSGGMDSGAITAVAARQFDSLKTFTVGFDLSSASGLELGFDERRQAEHMSYLFGTEHYEMVLKAGDMERVMPQLVWQLEEPRVGQSYPNYYAAKLASKFGKVVLAGTGGDELFGGYPWRYYRAVVNDDFEHYIDKYYVYWQRLIANREIHEVFSPVWESVRHVWTRDIFRDVFRHHAATLTRPEDYVNHSLYFEATTFLHGLLIVEDKLAMAHGLESRVPFLDNDLVDFALNVPVGMKLGNLGEVVKLNENEPGKKTQRYLEKARDGKLILRNVMERYVPKRIATGTKQGFSAPDASWFRGESIDYVRDIIFDDKAQIWDFLDKRAVRRLVQEHLDGRNNRRLLIWSLLNVEQWCQTFLNPRLVAQSSSHLPEQYQSASRI